MANPCIKGAESVGRLRGDALQWFILFELSFIVKTATLTLLSPGILLLNPKQCLSHMSLEFIPYRHDKHIASRLLRRVVSQDRYLNE